MWRGSMDARIEATPALLPGVEVVRVLQKPILAERIGPMRPDHPRRKDLVERSGEPIRVEIQDAARLGKEFPRRVVRTRKSRDVAPLLDAVYGLVSIGLEESAIRSGRL